MFFLKSLFFIFIFIFSNSLWACTVCGFGQDGSQWAFLVTTAVMTTVPLALFGSIVYFIYKKSKQVDQDE